MQYYPGAEHLPAGSEIRPLTLFGVQVGILLGCSLYTEAVLQLAWHVVDRLLFPMASSYGKM